MLSQDRLDEVAFVLGHEPGSPMTKDARFIPEAQQRIVDQAESALNGMLENGNVVPGIRRKHETVSGHRIYAKSAVCLPPPVVGAWRVWDYPHTPPPLLVIYGKKFQKKI